MLLSPLVTSISIANKLESISKFALNAVAACHISDKIKGIIALCFKGSTSSYLCTLGITELKQNVKKIDSNEKLNSTQEKILTASSPYLNLHGSLIIGSGALGLLDALQTFGLVSLRGFTQAVRTAGSVLFLAANIVALEENARLLSELIHTDWSQTNISDQELKWLKQSAFWGMLSNLGYIVATATLLFSGTTAITILIAALACCAGGVKIFFDVMNWAKKEKYI